VPENHNSARSISIYKNEVHRHQGAKRGPATGGYLSNEIADNTAIIDAHARTICVKDPGDPYLNKKQVTYCITSHKN